MKGYIKLRQYALEILNTRLSDKLTYHGIHHTLDVLNVCNEYIRRLNIDTKQAKLLRIGALYHDVGFSVTNYHHEERGVEIVHEMMKKLGVSEADFRIVKGLILATRIPQSPKTLLERIICDSDLDYLGRDDFYEISDTLYDELNHHGIYKNKNDYNIAQVKFLEAHSYHTEFAKKNRQPEKEKRIAEIRKLIKNDD